MTASEARQISDKANIEYDNAAKKDFLNEEELKKFLIKTIEIQAALGCIDFEFETDQNLHDTNILQYFKDNDYKVKFYQLDEQYATKKYCLYISW